MNWQEFITMVNSLHRPRILELGTQRTDPKVGTILKDNFTGYSEYLGIDLAAGQDVDIVGDIHKLSSVCGVESFDIIISIVTFEHLKYPFLAAHEIMKTLKIGGWLFLDTVQTFTIHNWPNDYFRFSTEALKALFGTQNGFTVKDTYNEREVFIVDKEYRYAGGGKAWRASILIGQKTAKTPKNFTYEFNYDSSNIHNF